MYLRPCVLQMGTSVFVAATLKGLLDHLALQTQQGLHSWVTWDSNRCRNGSWQATTTGAQYRQQIGTHYQSFCERDLFASPEVSASGARFWFGTHLEVNNAALQGQRTLDAILGFPSALLQATRKDLIYLFCAPIFVTAAQGPPLDCMDLMDCGTYACSLTSL